MVASVIYSNQLYWPSLAKWRGLATRQVGDLYQIQGYKSYNNLLAINAMFSSCPSGEPIDRTGNLVITPLKRFCRRPWKYFTNPISLEQALAQRVKELVSLNQKINVLWSGGIDSTTIVNACIANMCNLDQLRILYSPFSRYEHAEFLAFIKSKNIETVDISGMVYLETQFDGIFVTGDTGDECHASLDESFFDQYGADALSLPWRDYFWNRTKNQKFMDFCDQYFSLAGREITTLLHARWWFYINSKLYSVLEKKLLFWTDYENFNIDLVHGFFDCDSFDQYITHHIDDILLGNRYEGWKQALKNYCFSVDGFDNWRRKKTKVHSNQIVRYISKKATIKKLHAILLLDDGTRIATPSLPLLSRSEFTATYRDNLNDLWNEPDKV